MRSMLHGTVAPVTLRVAARASQIKCKNRSIKQSIESLQSLRRVANRKKRFSQLRAASRRDQWESRFARIIINKFNIFLIADSIFVVVFFFFYFFAHFRRILYGCNTVKMICLVLLFLSLFLVFYFRIRHKQIFTQTRANTPANTHTHSHTHDTRYSIDGSAADTIFMNPNARVVSLQLIAIVPIRKRKTPSPAPGSACRHVRFEHVACTCCWHKCCASFGYMLQARAQQVFFAWDLRQFQRSIAEELQMILA